MEKEGIDTRIEKLNKKISRLSPPKPEEEKRPSKNRMPYIAATLLGIVLIVSAFFLGPQITGLVTFSEAVLNTEQTNITLTESGNVLLEPGIKNIDAIMLSGTVIGSGRVSVFIETPQGKKLVYYFEGDAGQGTSFNNMCFDTCYITELPKRPELSIKLENMQLQIDQVSYMSSKIIDFELQPKDTVIDYNTEKARTVELTLTNGQKTNYTIILLVDGPLTSFFSWDGSLVKMTANETEKKIPIMIKLPSNLPAGTYTHKISARYVPPDGQQFTGMAPVDEAWITVVNQ